MTSESSSLYDASSLTDSACGRTATDSDTSVTYRYSTGIYDVTTAVRSSSRLQYDYCWAALRQQH